MAIINGRPMFFKNKQQQAAEGDYMVLCSPHRPSKPIEGPIALRVDFVFPWRSTETKRNRALGRMPKTSIPDCDNAGKALIDCLTKLGFWANDSQVADLHITKAWGDAVGVYASIHPILTTTLDHENRI